MSGLFDGFPNAEQVAALAFLRNGPVDSPGLAISAASSPAPKAGAFSYRIDGKIYAKAAQATIALTTGGSVAAGATGAYFLSLDAAGDLAVTLATADSNGAIAVPTPAAGYAFFGAVKVANGSGAAFTAGTTALDATGITATYFNLAGIVPGETL